MQTDKYFYLGKILRTKGTKGELKIKLDVDDQMAYAGLSHVFIQQRNNLIPFPIERIHLEVTKANLKIKDVNTTEAAENFVNCELYLPIELLPKLSGNKFYYHEIIGFNVHDHEYGPIGVVEEVLEYPSNPLFRVVKGEYELLIPITDEVIVKLDRDKKCFEIKAPEGLIELYLPKL